MALHAARVKFQSSHMLLKTRTTIHYSSFLYYKNYPLRWLIPVSVLTLVYLSVLRLYIQSALSWKLEIRIRKILAFNLPCYGFVL